MFEHQTAVLPEGASAVDRARWAMRVIADRYAPAGRKLVARGILLGHAQALDADLKALRADAASDEEQRP
jgi:hypothetical protein